MSSQPLAPSAADAIEEARRRARIVLVGTDPMGWTARRRGPGSRAHRGGGLRPGRRLGLAIGCAALLLVVAAFVAWPPVRTCHELGRAGGLYAGDSLEGCIRRGVADRLSQAGQSVKALARGPGR